ncbi:hypothetical protein KGM_202765 [Danaus plexippus plexippus]|uniref:Uncharacterized protein n=1 Tax=Danaus plexippus plexippus TaxID=278856 RepID=A0A212F214_DANPL|nr:hypothetical protein KGM_202765 [Danaus plexippus plexippus]
MVSFSHAAFILTDAPQLNYNTPRPWPPPPSRPPPSPQGNYSPKLTSVLYTSCTTETIEKGLRRQQSTHGNYRTKLLFFELMLPGGANTHNTHRCQPGVINGSTASAPGAGAVPARGEGRRRGASSPARAAPEKRRWPAQPYHDDELAARAPSSDDDDTKVETPVRFRTSPPLEALKPRRALGGGGESCGCARAPSSPRRRRLPLPPPRRHRPALDFDKMQQLKVGGGGARSWRAVGGGARGGELSVFCW